MAYGAGDLSERVKLLHRVETPDGAGGAAVSWSEYAEVWALVRPMTGRERAAADRVEASAGYLVVIYARTDVLDSDIVRWRGRDLNLRFPKRRGPQALYMEFEAEIGAAN